MSAPPAPLQPPFAGTLGTLLRDRALAAPDSTLLIHRGAAISVGVAVSSRAGRAIRPSLRDAGGLKTPFGKAVA
ncbi:MAG: hypothetical protein ABGW82_12655, partial [Paracoccus sp. (in: a-proteobacteria)]